MRVKTKISERLSEEKTGRLWSDCEIEKLHHLHNLISLKIQRSVCSEALHTDTSLFKGIPVRNTLISSNSFTRTKSRRRAGTELSLKCIGAAASSPLNMTEDPRTVELSLRQETVDFQSTETDQLRVSFKEDVLQNSGKLLFHVTGSKNKRWICLFKEQ